MGKDLHDPAANNQPREQSRRSLSRETLEGFLWMFAGAGGQAVLRVVVIAVLARLLTPADFGIVSAAMTVIALADIFGQIGISPAIVQMSDLSSLHVRVAFTISAISGVLMTTFCALGAPTIANVFQMNAVEPIVATMGIIFTIRGFGIVAEGMMQRQMRFRAIAIINLASYGLGYGACAVGLAIFGFGVWALVLGQIFQVAISSILFLAFSRHPISPSIDRHALSALLRFGMSITLSSVGNYVALNSDQIIVGRSLGPAALGIYNRTYATLMQPVNLFGAVGDKVLFPALASIQSDRARLTRAYYRSFSLIALATLPLGFFLTLFAKDIINLLFGGRWTSIIEPFQILSLSLFFRTAYKITSSLLRARGLIMLLAAWQWAYAGLVFVGAYAGANYGLVGVSAGVAIAIAATFAIGLFLSRYACGVSLRVLSLIVLRYLVLSMIIILPLVVLRALLTEWAGVSQWTLLPGVFVGGLITLTILHLSPSIFGEEGTFLLSAIQNPVGRK
jgi:PST family polysaccharide transporter